LYRYQTKGVARGAIRIVMKTKGQQLGVFGLMEERAGAAGLVFEYHSLV
jgi:hypothetical protein